MKTILLLTSLISLNVSAQTSFLSSGKELTKAKAMLALASGQAVTKCQELELSETKSGNLTMKAKKAAKK